MNYLRNFFYNTSDIIIAAAIVLISAIVIWTRIDAIMSYSAEVDQTVKTKAEEQIDPDTGDSDATIADIASDATTTTPTDTVTSGSATEPTTTDPVADDSPTVTDDGTTVAFEVSPGRAASEIAQDLVDAGLITDKDAFLKQCKDSGADTKFKSGSFTIKKGATTDEIINILIRS